MLILEGGAAGHMMHPYENPDLEFSKMMDIIRAAAGGFQGIDVTEKIDGQNVYIGYDLDKKEPLAIRNKAHQAAGGLSKTKLRSYFTTDRVAAGKPQTPENVVGSFEEAMDDFDDAMEELSEQELQALFRDADGNAVFYNSEILNPQSVNVIDYDVKKLVIHRAGAAALRDGRLYKLPAKASEVRAAQMTRILGQYSKEALPRVIVNNIMNLQDQISGLEGNAADAISQLKRIISKYNIADNETVADYIIAVAEEKGQQFGLEDEALQKFVSSVMFFYEKQRQTKRNANGVTSAMKDGDKDAVRDFLLDQPGLRAFIKSAIAPIEDVVHNFGVDLLATTRSLYVTKHPQSIAKLQSKVGEVFAGDTPYSEKDLKLLRRAMVKMKGGDADDTLEKEYKNAMKRIATDVEGLVFDFDGATYKFTGNFAPINQVLGISRYSRGGTIAEQLERENKRTIAIYPGRFQPMGRHHYETYKKIAEEYGINDTFIATSDKVKLPKSPLNFSEKEQVMLKHGIPEGQVVEVRNPYYAKEIYEQYPEDEVEVVYFVGRKDMEDNPRFAKTAGVTKEGYDWSIGVAPHVSIDIPEVGEMSGTSLRQALSDASEQEFESIMGFEDEQLRHMLSDKFKSAINEHFIFDMIGDLMEPRKERILESINQLDEYKGQVIEVVFETKEDMIKAFENLEEDEEDIIDEISSMVGGSVEGYSLPLGDKPKKRY